MNGKVVQVNLRNVDADLWRRVRKMAIDREITLLQAVTEMAREWLRKKATNG